MADSTSETPVLDLLANMTADSVAASSLDPETLMLVRIAALVAVDAPSFSYLMNLEVASELDIDPERIRGVLAAVAPIVGTPRVASATGKIVEALVDRDRRRVRGAKRRGSECGNGSWLIRLEVIGRLDEPSSGLIIEGVSDCWRE